MINSLLFISNFSNTFLRYGQRKKLVNRQSRIGGDVSRTTLCGLVTLLRRPKY